MSKTCPNTQDDHPNDLERATPRREAAVKCLIDLGYAYYADSGRWEPCDRYYVQAQKRAQEEPR